ncbi:MAG TPA: Fe-S cluster assembly protein SufB [Thermoplasmata archaeon]
MTAVERSRPRVGEHPAAVMIDSVPSADRVRDFSVRRREPEWMLRFRLKALERFRSEGVPAWAHFLNRVEFDRFLEPAPDRPLSTRPTDAALATGFAALGESEAAYRVVRQELETQGVHFLSTEAALAEHPDLFREVFTSAVAIDDNPLAALNAALWSGGSFVYVPPGVRVEAPLQAEIRADYGEVEPFERHLILADRGSEVTYIEGCSAPVYTPDELHVSAIEVVARPGARVRYIAIQNFSKKVDNLVTKRAVVQEGASVEWVDANLGARRMWKVPVADLVGPDASAEIIGFALAGKGQHVDVGGIVRHRAPRTRSRIVQRMVAREGGEATLHTDVEAAKGASGASSSIDWSTLLLDSLSRTETVPRIELDEADAEIAQEGVARTASEEMLFYLTSRGLTRDEAVRMIVLGLAEVATKRIPFEFAIEVNRIIELDLGEAIG